MTIRTPDIYKSQKMQQAEHNRRKQESTSWLKGLFTSDNSSQSINPGEAKGGESIKTTRDFGANENAPNQTIGNVAEKSLELAAAGKALKKGGGTNKAALAKMAAGAVGIESDNAAGGAVNTALTAATMTGNPYIIAGAAVFGAIQGSAEADRQKREARAKGIEAESKALSKGEAARRASVGRMSESMAGFFNNNRIAKL